MSLEAQIYAADILKAIGLIERFTKNFEYEAYCLDVLRISAVERQLGIIGEAVTQMVKLNSSFSVRNAKQIIGFRNILIHNYARVSQAVIWTIVIDELPVLKIECEAIVELT